MEDFFERIKPLLSEDEFKIFKNEYSKTPFVGVRVNTLKCSPEKFESLMKSEGTEIKKTPFSPVGYYIEDKSSLSGKHPLHHAGAVYFQEPSAMSAATLLSPEKGEKVLDLCAAPGGKSTQLAAYLDSEGLIWCNEYVRSRANILISNIERCGIGNAVVSSCEPEALCSALEGYFDRILVDAPCSGEGMFRRDENAYSEWTPEHSNSCAVRQLKILESAKKALKPGGTLVYSTCTFSKAENEDGAEKFLANNPDFELLSCDESFGRAALDGKSTRIFPMDGGEGHFAAKFRKISGESGGYAEVLKPTDTRKLPDFVKAFFEDTFDSVSMLSRAYLQGDKLYILPENCPEIKGLGVLRAGVFAGLMRKNYFEPAHALFMAESRQNINRVVDLKIIDPRVQKFLRGEEIDVDENVKGYAALCVEGIVTGFGKVSEKKLKNKYPKGLRLL